MFYHGAALGEPPQHNKHHVGYGAFIGWQALLSYGRLGDLPGSDQLAVSLAERVQAQPR